MKRLTLFLLLALTLSACVIESTTDPMAKNRDEGKALRAYVQLGMAYIQDREMTQASRVLNKAAKINSDDAALNNAYGLFYLLEEDNKKAEEHFLRAIRSDAEFSAAYNNYATLLYNAGRYAEAVKYLKVATRQYRYDRRFQIYESLGNCYIQLNEQDKAEHAYLKALQLFPRLPNSMLGLAELYLEKGNYALSKQYLTQHEAIAKPSAKQLWVGIRLQRQLGDVDKLASYELALRRLFPGSPEYREYEKTATP
ncbi:Putative pilus assembly protein [gamma proteobacterium HdN1]|nr:Putative pilus assembly protein [gamma proteobacterium HdN1]